MLGSRVPAHSYGLPGWRVSGEHIHSASSCAVVMRVIPTTVPDFATLACRRNWRSGQSSRWHRAGHRTAGLGEVIHSGGAAGLHQCAAGLSHHYHRRPIEFLHSHKKAPSIARVAQRYSSFAQALRAALRQAHKSSWWAKSATAKPRMLLEAAETGHLVLSSLNTVMPQRRGGLLSVFAFGEQQNIRRRIAKTLRYVVSQRLLPA